MGEKEKVHKPHAQPPIARVSERGITYNSCQKVRGEGKRAPSLPPLGQRTITTVCRKHFKIV